MNPFAFRPAQVTLWTTIIYLALVIPLVVLNETVPPPPASPTPYAGVNLTEAWLDLAELTRGYHPYNSHKNDQVRNWLLLRVQAILDQNEADWTTESTISTPPPSNYSARPLKLSREEATIGPSHNVTVFNDLLSNVTLSFGGTPGSTQAGTAAYFEGTNIFVYIRGTLDEEGEWWKKRGGRRKMPIGKGGVLVNAHYDSVSTGFGATDDGVGVVTVLQLIKYFTTPGHQPRHGIVAMLNNGEEDTLWGARAFGNSPLLPFVHTFLNLEGAGAGGRAMLFRSTDQEVTSAYSKSPHPFGTVIGSDAFGLGVIKSQTDYVVLNGVYGQRGLDVAFYKPRARYHTAQDDVKHASKASLWHMLSASVISMRELSGATGETFVGDRPDKDKGKVPNGRPSNGVWFDLFGSGFVLFNLRGMFAWSLTLLIATPLILVLLSYLAQNKGKYYFFSNRVNIYEHADSGPEDYERVKIGGLKGISRFPLALIVAGALTFGSAFLLRKINPFIIYSSKYSVWAMMISLFYFVFWAIMRGADFTRPSALHRGYIHIWLFTLGWILLVGVTVSEDRFQIASGYLFVFLQSALFLTTFITLAELFALPNQKSYGTQARDRHEIRDHLDAVPNADALIAPSPGEFDGSSQREEDDRDEDNDHPSETTPLVGRSDDENSGPTFATTYRRPIAALTEVTSKSKRETDENTAYGYEQPWSGTLPTWTWLLQFLLLGPFIIILVAETGLTLVDGMNQTGTDGSSLLIPYLAVAFFSILLLLPVAPNMHRITHHIPLLLLCVFIATLIYNLVAFPFSSSNKYKAFWQQTVNLDTGSSTVKFGGFEEYLRPIIAELPSAAGKEVTCGRSSVRPVSECTYDGSDVPPNVANNVIEGVPPQKGYADLVSFKVTPGAEPGQAAFKINAKNTKSCILKFKKPIKKFSVAGGTDWDDRFGRVPDGGITQILLWRRDWEKTWEVSIEWDPESKNPEAVDEDDSEERAVDELKARTATGMEGNVTCIWSDINTPGVITALDEAIKYAPAWAGITKLAAGLVEGSKAFQI